MFLFPIFLNLKSDELHAAFLRLLYSNRRLRGVSLVELYRGEPLLYILESTGYNVICVVCVMLGNEYVCEKVKNNAVILSRRSDYEQ